MITGPPKPPKRNAFPGTGSSTGMSMREWYAGMALNAILSSPTWNAASLAGLGVSDVYATAAGTAFRYADEMLAWAAKEKR